MRLETTDGTKSDWRAASEKLPVSAVTTKALRLASVSMIYRDLEKVIP